MTEKPQDRDLPEDEGFREFKETLRQLLNDPPEPGTDPPFPTRN